MSFFDQAPSLSGFCDLVGGSMYLGDVQEHFV
jgi:hypothetical protein